jgi:phosphoadenosine phosphosulfate reductase
VISKMVTTDFDISDEELLAVSDSFETKSPEAALRWTIEQFGREVALATGFGAEGCILIDMVSRIDRNVRIFYLDTDLLFPETYDLIRKLEARYGISFERRATRLTLTEQAAEYGERLWELQPDLCCQLRKVEPLEQVLTGLKAWITAIRRDQTPARANARIVERDRKFHLIKVNPLAAWTAREVWKYLKQYNVPYNSLYDQGYGSIGCTHCTTLVQIGEDPRAGRWRGNAKTECGLHK